jgi:DNA-binding NtrC family response regulator
MDAMMSTQKGSQIPKILIACGEAAYADTLARFLDDGGRDIECVRDAKSVLKAVASGKNKAAFDIVVLDLALHEEEPLASGNLDLMSFIRRQQPDARILLLFELSRIERAIEGIRNGAFFYLPRNSQPSDVALVVDKALRQIKKEAVLDEFEQNAFEAIVGGAPAMKRVIELVTKVAPTDSTVLLLGESGTGKDVFAQAVHRLSARRDKPFIAINCAALPETLLESEMFGHVKGAFTGASSDKRGLFEEADGGSIFLDEIGDMSPITQAKLLRVLQNGEIRPVGASTVKHVDVRVIAATNRNLIEAARAGKFREDLYFRLNVIQIRIPPLRERMDALPALVNHFITRFDAKFGKSVKAIDDHATALLKNYAYPGNIRELESIIAHAVILCDGDIVAPRDLPDSVRATTISRLALPNYAGDRISSLSELEEMAIRSALDRHQGNQTEAAKSLGISRSTLWRKMKEYNIEADARESIEETQ